MSKQIVSVDFDGVLHSYTTGWKGADVILDPPVDGAIEFLLEALKHFEVHIFSTRSHQPGGREAMIEWLVKHGLPKENIEAVFPEHLGKSLRDMPTVPRIKFPTTKPPALVMIDDRAICFKGIFPSMEVLKNFKPWNKG